MLISILDIFRPSIGSQLVKGKIIVSQLSFQLSNFIIEFFQSGFKLIVKLLVFVNLLRFSFQLVCLLLHSLNKVFLTIIFSLSLVT